MAVGLLGDPQLLVLDEPATGVDLVHRTAMYRLLRDRADEGCGVLMSTHSVADAALADRVVVVVEGRVAYAGPLAGIADLAGDHTAAHGMDAVSAGLLQLWTMPSTSAGVHQ